MSCARYCNFDNVQLQLSSTDMAEGVMGKKDCWLVFDENKLETVGGWVMRTCR